MPRWVSFSVTVLGPLAVLALAMGLAHATPRFVQALYQRYTPDGLLVTYHRGTELDHPVCRRGELEAFKNYEKKRPALGVPRDHFSARWDGFLMVPSNAVYTFFAQSMDGIRVYINEVMVIDNWKENEWLTSGARGDIALTAGPHRLRIDHYNAGGPAALRVRWTGGGLPPNTLLAHPWVRKRVPEAWLRYPPEDKIHDD